MADAEGESGSDLLAQRRDARKQISVAVFRRVVLHERSS